MNAPRFFPWDQKEALAKVLRLLVAKERAVSLEHVQRLKRVVSSAPTSIATEGAAEREANFRLALATWRTALDTDEALVAFVEQVLSEAGL